MLYRILSFIVIFSACGPATTASRTEDVTTDLGTLPDAYLYYVDGPWVVQAKYPSIGARTREHWYDRRPEIADAKFRSGEP